MTAPAIVQQFEYELLIDSQEELESWERSATILNATRINQEGWTSEYSGSGIRFWFTCTYPKRAINQMVRACSHTKLVRSSPVHP